MREGLTLEVPMERFHIFYLLAQIQQDQKSQKIQIIFLINISYLIDILLCFH